MQETIEKKENPDIKVIKENKDTIENKELKEIKKVG
jgi:hypothetical protein